MLQYYFEREEIAGKDYSYLFKDLKITQPDIVLVQKEKANTGYIFEFKLSSTKSSKTLEPLVGDAKKQITTKQYVEGVNSVHAIKTNV